MRHLQILVPLGLILMCLGGCAGKEPNPYVLADFDSESELDQCVWTCHTLFALSPEHATHGSKALRFDFFPSEYPGIHPKFKKKDWTGYRFLSFDVYNPQPDILKLTVRIDDQERDPEYGERYNHSIPIEPGANSISIPLDTLITSGSTRKLNLSSIHTFLVFMPSPKEKKEMFFDYFRLEK